MKLENSWFEFERWLSTNCPELDGVLNAGASPEQLQALESELGINLPDDFKSFYSFHDGQVEASPGLFDGLAFLSLSDILQAWRWLNGFVANERMDQLDAGIAADRGIAPVYWKKSWVPYLHSDCGNCYCLDLEPTSEGTSGQIIAVWLIPPERSLLARSIGDWFQNYVGRVLAGDYEYFEDEDGLVAIDD